MLGAIAHLHGLGIVHRDVKAGGGEVALDLHNSSSSVAPSLAAADCCPLYLTNEG